MPAQTVVIVNPSSAKGSTAEQFAGVRSELESLLGGPQILFTQGLLDATRIARDKIRQGATLIVVVGGDGTINEVVNGFFDEQGELINPKTSLGILPSGTGDDFRKTLGWTKGIRPNIARLRQGQVKHIDLGLVKASDGEGGTRQNYFVNVASCGLSGSVSKQMKTATRAFGSSFAYYWTTVKTLWSYHQPTIRTELDGKRVLHPKCSLVAYANGQYFGGGMNIAPGARIDDGRFDQITVSKMGLLFFLRDGHKVYKGTHIGMPQVSRARGRVAFVESQTEEPVYIEADGEDAGQLPAKFEIVPGVLPLLV
jgi:YegS/Rv2252/BmrU family lipid kinase